MNKRILTIAAPLVFIFLTAGVFAQTTAPPPEKNKREADLLELIKLDPTIKLDIRYATENNFVGKAVYPEARAFLQRDAAEALLRVHRKLKEQGLGLVIFDGYRPWTITKLFWETVRPDQRKFVANPANGSKHNRGCAVDLSIYDLKTGALLPMPSGFDEFTERAAPDYAGGTIEETKNRELLRRLMEAEGFTVNPNEWWHFDYKDWKEYAIYDVAFSEIRNLDELKDFNVRRVEFAGNATTRDRAVRRKVFLQEGDLFAPENLRKSVDGMNALGIFHPIGEQNVSWFLDKARKQVDFVFYLEEKSKKDISAAKTEEKKDLKRFFDEAGVTGGIYIYDPQKNKFTVYDRRRMDAGFVPASTSKIIHSLIFLDTGAIKDENEILKWDGTRRSIEAWNRDHDLRSALKASAVWFYVELSKRVGQDKMQRVYDAANYGNRLTQGFGADYWNTGALRLTPREQIEFLVRFYEHRLPFSSRSIETVKNILLDEKTDRYVISGKTGWSDAFTPQVGWWIGYVETGGKVYYFATEIDIKNREDAAQRKAITKKVLQSLKIIE